MNVKKDKKMQINKKYRKSAKRKNGSWEEEKVETSKREGERWTQVRERVEKKVV